MSGTVKYMYLRDTKNPKRIMTVARQITDDEKIRIGWAVCHPTVKDGKYIVDQGDEFTKKRGRAIALGRMNKPDVGLLVDLNGQKPIAVVINALLNAKGIVGKVALAHVVQRQKDMEKQAVQKEDEE